MTTWRIISRRTKRRSASSGGEVGGSRTAAEISVSLRKCEMARARFGRRLVRRFAVAVLVVTPLSLFVACGREPTSGDGGSAPRVLWQRLTPPTQIRDGRPGIAASGTGIFIGYSSTLTAIRPGDGALLWQKRGGANTSTPTFRPVVFGDSVVAVGGGGTASGYRQRTGDVLWTRPIPGPVLTSQPVVAGPYVVFGNAPGELWAIEGLTGATRRLATMAQLTDTAGAGIWGMTSQGDTVVVFIQRDHPTGEFGDFFVTRILASSGEVVSRSRIARRDDEFPENRPFLVADTVAVLPISGCGVGVDVRTGHRLWRQCGSARVLRNGLLYAERSVSDILVVDPRTGALVRVITTVGSSVSDVYPCREGLVYTAFSLNIVDDRSGARSRAVAGSVQDDLYSTLAWHGNVLYAHGERVITALTCT